MPQSSKRGGGRRATPRKPRQSHSERPEYTGCPAPARRRRGIRRCKTLREAMSTDDKGLKVIVADGECQLARQRRIRPQIAAQLKRGERVMVSAHGNSLRALEKHLSNIADADIVGLEIPTGQPIVYELADDLSVRDRYYLNER